MDLLDTLAEINKIKDKLAVMHREKRKESYVSDGQRGDIGAGGYRPGMGRVFRPEGKDFLLPESE